MTSSHRLSPSATAVAVIDMQEAFRRVMADYDAIAARIAILMRGARLLGVPIVWCEMMGTADHPRFPEVQKLLV
ncbi:MAG: isochorismatase family protein [Planctomycetota bacterium]